MVASSGGVWADQLIHWRRYQHHWLTFPLLALVTAVFAILGLLPLMNNFAHIAGFVAGFLACSIALLNRRVSIVVSSLPLCLVVLPSFDMVLVLLYGMPGQFAVWLRWQSESYWFQEIQHGICAFDSQNSQPYLGCPQCPANHNMRS